MTEKNEEEKPYVAKNGSVDIRAMHLHYYNKLRKAIIGGVDNLPRSKSLTTEQDNACRDIMKKGLIEKGVNDLINSSPFIVKK